MHQIIRLLLQKAQSALKVVQPIKKFDRKIPEEKINGAEG